MKSYGRTVAVQTPNTGPKALLRVRGVAYGLRTVVGGGKPVAARSASLLPQSHVHGCPWPCCLGGA